MRISLTCLLLLLYITIYGQAAPYETSEPEGAVDRAVRGRQGREAQFARALQLYTQESYAESRAIIDSLAHDDTGKLIYDSLSGLAYHMAGMTYYQVYDDANAIPMYRKSIMIRDSIFPGPHFNRAHTRYNLANSMHWIGRPDTAVVLLRDAIAIYDAEPKTDTTNWLRSLKLLGVIAREAADYELLRSATIAMTSLLAEFSQPTPMDAYQMSFDAVLNFLDLKDYSKAEGFAPAAIAAARKLRDKRLEADVVNARGMIFYRQQLYAEARKQFRNAVEMHRNIAGDPTSIHLGLENLAAVANETGDYALALRLLDEAQAYPADPDDPLAPSVQESFRAEVYANLGRHSEAEAAFNHALARSSSEAALRVTRHGSYLDRDSISSLKHIVDLYGRRATTRAERGQREAALADLNEIYFLTHTMRRRVHSDESRQALSAEGWSYYNLGVQLNMESYGVTGADQYLRNALRLSEAAKAYTQLVSQQNRKRATSRLRHDRDRRLAELKRTKLGDANREAEYANLLLRREMDLRSSTQPSVADHSIFINTDTLSRLYPKYSFVEYHVSDTISYAFFWGPGQNLKSWTLPGADSLASLVRTFRNAIVNGAYQGKPLRPAGEQLAADAAFAQAGMALSEMLLRPLGNDVSKLIIIPDGVLHFAPYAALFRGEPDVPLNYQRLSYYSQDTEMTTALSAKHLLELRNRPEADHPNNLLAFAPKFTGSASSPQLASLRGEALEAGTKGALTKPLPSLQALKGNIAEVEALADAVPLSRAYTGAAATLNAFAAEVAGYQIVHIASHGIADPDYPSRSFVSFNQPEVVLDQSQLLFYDQISLLPSGAELVVLSACETSLGKFVPGESVLSLGNAFMAAGARSTVTSLWNVDDVATKQLMVAFYNSIEQGQSRGAALHAAQARLRAGGDYVHPYYWSGFVLTGATEPINLGGGMVLPWWVWLTLPLAIGPIFAWRHFMNRSTTS